MEACTTARRILEKHTFQNTLIEYAHNGEKIDGWQTIVKIVKK